MLMLAESRAANDNGSMIRTVATAALGLIVLAVPAPAQDQPPRRAPFTATLSNNAPLVFGMTVEEAAAALNAPLKYIRGKPGDEVFAAPRWWQSASYFDRHDQLFLQFRKGRLAGWKGDWGKNWMWE
jgi:hypothetical protein